MLKLTGIKATPTQIFRVPIDQGTIKILLMYKPAVTMWFMNIEFGDKIINGIRVNRNLNIIEQYNNVLPFGILINVIEGTEPLLIDDFSSGRIEMNILNQSEMDQIDALYKENKVLL